MVASSVQRFLAALSGRYRSFSARSLWRSSVIGLAGLALSAGITAESLHSQLPDRPHHQITATPTAIQRQIHAPKPESPEAIKPWSSTQATLTGYSLTSSHFVHRQLSEHLSSSDDDSSQQQG